MVIEADRGKVALMKPETIQTQVCEFILQVRPDLKEVITPESPFGYWSMEYYSPKAKGPKGQGGLGMLASDTIETAIRLGLPMVLVTPFYAVERSYAITEDFEQIEIYENVRPEDRGLIKKGQVSISTLAHEYVPIDVYTQQMSQVTKVMLTEPNIGQLYEDKNNSNKRLYQEVVEGFAGCKALELLGIKPSVNHYLNEEATVFAALARLDGRVKQLRSELPDAGEDNLFAAAFVDIKRNTVYTNHTLVQAAGAEFTLEQFEHFVIPNLESEQLKKWLRDKFNSSQDKKIKLSALAIALSGKKNGVSLIHAREASKIYKDENNNPVEFAGVTNGIDLDRWTDPQLLQIYRQTGIFDQFGRPGANYQEKIDGLDSSDLLARKDEAKKRLRGYLKDRLDQYGQAIDIPEGEKIFNWRRRFAHYKRPDMLLSDPQKLADILEKEQIHLLLAGNVHPEDQPMRDTLKKMLNIIDGNPVLKARVHFVQNYDEDLAREMVAGADVSINTPTVIESGVRVSTEACGTSWEKDVINNTILISTEDGGVADARIRAMEAGAVGFQPPYLEITGQNYDQEVKSLYDQMQMAANILNSKDATVWEEFVKKQLKAFLPVISGARMAEEYLNLGAPPP